MPDSSSWGTDDSAGTVQPSEQAAVDKRAQTLALITAGLGMMASQRQMGENQWSALSRGIGNAGMAGLNTYFGVEQDAQQTAMNRQKMALESAQTEQALQKGKLDMALTALNLRKGMPIGRDPFTRFRGNKEMEDFFPDAETASQLSIDEVPKVYESGIEAYQKAQQFKNEGKEVKIEDGADGLKHTLVYDRNKNLISDTPIAGVPVKTSDKTTKDNYVDPKTGLSWQVTYDLHSGKPIAIGGASGQKYSGFMHGDVFGKPYQPPPLSDIPPLAVGMRTGGASAGSDETAKSPANTAAAYAPNVAKEQRNPKTGEYRWIDKAGNVHAGRAPTAGGGGSGTAEAAEPPPAAPAGMTPTPSATPTSMMTPTPVLPPTGTPTPPMTPPATPTATPTLAPTPSGPSGTPVALRNPSTGRLRVISNGPYKGHTPYVSGGRLYVRLPNGTWKDIGAAPR